MPAVADQASQIKRTRQHARLAEMSRVRQPRYNHWRDITQYLIPYAGRYLASERDNSVNRYQDIIDETGIHSLMVLESGLMATRTNPALTWFVSQTPDEDLNHYPPVAEWLFNADRMLRRILYESNTYTALPHLYSEMGAFGTAATIVVDDFETIIHHHILTAGEFYIDVNNRDRVDTLYREFQLSVKQLVEEFGIKNCSKNVQSKFNSRNDKQLGTLIKVVNAIEPRPTEERSIYGRADSRSMPWRSCYFEVESDHGEYLRETGHRRFPCITPRWRVTGGDVWGEGPGTMALGSTRELQVLNLTRAKVIDFDSDPPKQIPTAAKGRERDMLPGGNLPYDQTSPHGGVRTAFELPLEIDKLQHVLEDVRRRIERSFHVPLFQPMSYISDTTERTKYETMLRSREALTLLGPVAQRLNNEIDKPLLSIGYERMFEEGLLPPPPKEMQGMPLDIRYEGPLVQALKEVQAQGLETFRLHLGQIAALQATGAPVVDKYNGDADVDRVANMLGIDPDLVVGNEQVALIRQSRAESDQAMAQMEALESGSASAKNLAAAAK